MTMTRVSVPGSAQGLLEVAGAFDVFSREQGIAEPVARSVQVVLDEVLSNTVRSGFAPGRIGRIEVRFELIDGVLDILIVDDGIAFDPRSGPEPDTAAPLESRPVGGLGIHLVKKLMDGVAYERREGTNRLRLRKRIIGV
jgi:anti-sigma regulatory factor (Ser/Thr protein kinase)